MSLFDIHTLMFDIKSKIKSTTELKKGLTQQMNLIDNLNNKTDDLIIEHKNIKIKIDKMAEEREEMKHNLIKTINNYKNTFYNLYNPELKILEEKLKKINNNLMITKAKFYTILELISGQLKIQNLLTYTDIMTKNKLDKKQEFINILKNLYKSNKIDKSEYLACLDLLDTYYNLQIELTNIKKSIVDYKQYLELIY